MTPALPPRSALEAKRSGVASCPLPRFLITDMDGVLWHGQEPMPGLVEFFKFLRERSIKFVCATNNASTLPERLAERLQGWGTDITPDEIVTSSTATADYLTTILPLGSKLYIIGMEGLRKPLVERGFEIGEDGVAAVVVGIDWNMTYNQLKKAALLVRAGVPFIGTNGDRTFPSSECIIPGNGAIYVVHFRDAVYVLHAFQKKAKSGIATPKREIELILQRLKLARRLAGEGEL